MAAQEPFLNAHSPEIAPTEAALKVGDLVVGVDLQSRVDTNLLQVSHPRGDIEYWE